MFQLILYTIALTLSAGFYWLTGRWLSLYGISAKKRAVRLLRASLSLLLLLLFYHWGTAGLIAFHLLVLFSLTEAIAAGVRRAGKPWRSKPWYAALRRLYRTGLLPAALTCVLMLYGAYNMGRIVRTEYTLQSDKLTREYDIILLTDTHFDTIQEPAVLAKAVAEINALEPDLVVLGGDIVEENTTKTSMEEGFRILGALQSTYGTYYVYGNHDRQNYSLAAYGYRSYTPEELAGAMEQNGITILRDSWVPIGGDLLLAGREDAGMPRKTIADVLDGADRSRFVVVADHQPVEAAQNAAAGADLEISGHTHGGQIFPIGCFTALSGNFNYGLYQEASCTVIVSSGAAGWGFPIRTQERSEYVRIHLEPAGD